MENLWKTFSILQFSSVFGQTGFIDNKCDYMQYDGTFQVSPPAEKAKHGLP